MRLQHGNRFPALCCCMALTLISLAGPLPVDAQEVETHRLMEVYFGNFHVHTSYSFDGYTNGATAGPDAAYRWAQGEAISSGGGAPMQILKPLDWYVVADHAEYLGVLPKMGEPDNPFSKLELAERVNSEDGAVSMAAYAEMLQSISNSEPIPEISDPQVISTIWQEVVATADKHYKPGEFTTFPGFEWTSNPGERNLHRVVIFRDSEHVPDIPFSALDSDRPEDLWTWMDQQRDAGSTLFAIPHNGNASDGLMFPEGTSYGGSEIDSAYVADRMRNEPVYEINQIKGASETHPLLSPNDEFADFQIWDYTLAPNAPPPEHKKGGYMREALIRGLVLEREGIGNPFKYGFIGDSDTHNAASTIEENNHTGKFGFENTPEHRLLGPPGLSEGEVKQVQEFGSAGVAGVWAESNTREAIFDAVARKETFATSGPRLRVRFFGGWHFGADAMDGGDWIQAAYDNGVPMGGDLTDAPDGAAPTFLIAAMKEAEGANLDRIQIVKGWVEDGQPQEKIFDVALSDGRTVGAGGSVPAVGNTVDAATASYTNDIGEPQLMRVWTDPEFDPATHAVYYARVLQIPTPRWSTYDAARLGVAVPDNCPCRSRNAPGAPRSGTRRGDRNRRGG